MEQWGGGEQPKHLIVYGVRDWGVRNLTNLMSVWGSTSSTCKLIFISYVKPVVIWAFRRIKISMVTHNEFIDLMKMIRIKMMAFYAEMTFDRFGKELRFVGIGHGDLVCVVQSWIMALTLWLKAIFH